MKVRVTFEFDEGTRKAIANHYGREGLANYKTLRSFVEIVVSSTVETIVSENDVEEDKKTSG